MTALDGLRNQVYQDCISPKMKQSSQEAKALYRTQAQEDVAKATKAVEDIQTAIQKNPSDPMLQRQLTEAQGDLINQQLLRDNSLKEEPEQISFFYPFRPGVRNSYELYQQNIYQMYITIESSCRTEQKSNIDQIVVDYQRKVKADLDEATRAHQQALSGSLPDSTRATETNLNSAKWAFDMSVTTTIAQDFRPVFGTAQQNDPPTTIPAIPFSTSQPSLPSPPSMPPIGIMDTASDSTPIPLIPNEQQGPTIASTPSASPPSSPFIAAFPPPLDMTSLPSTKNTGSVISSPSVFSDRTQIPAGITIPGQFGKDAFLNPSSSFSSSSSSSVSSVSP